MIDGESFIKAIDDLREYCDNSSCENCIFMNKRCGCVFHNKPYSVFFNRRYD